MCHALLHDPAFFRLLTRIDAEFAAKTRQGRCPKCAGPCMLLIFRVSPVVARLRCARRTPGD